MKLRWFNIYEQVVESCCGYNQVLIHLKSSSCSYCTFFKMPVFNDIVVSIQLAHNRNSSVTDASASI